MDRVTVKRADLLKHLAILLEQDKIKIPNDEGLIAELESFRYEMGEGGSLKIRVPDGMSDDRVFSLALAVWGVSDKVTDYRILEQQWQTKSKPKGNIAR